MKCYKKLTLSLLTLIFCFITSTMGLVYFIDPLQQYRKASFYKPFYSTGYQRYLNPGIAKSFHYDSIITTTSIGDPLSTAYLDKQLKWQTVKLTIDGSTAYEQMRTLDTAIKTGKVTNVLYPLHYSSFGTETPKESKHDFPEYLYGNNIKLPDQIKYLLNFDIFATIMPRLFLANVFGIGSARLNSDQAYMEPDEFNINKKNKNSYVFNQLIFNQLKYDRDSWTDYTKMQTTKYIRNFDDLILPILANNKSISFYLIFPPFHLDYYCDDKNLKELHSILNFYYHIASVVNDLPNVSLYDFASEMSIVNQDIYYPTDNFHYNTAANNKIIDMIKVEKNKIQSNYLSYSTKFIKEIQSNCLKYRR